MSPHTRFVTDSSLEYLARRLRFLGFDVVTHRGARLEELFEVAAREGRVVLTLSARHPRRHADVGVVRVRHGEHAQAVRAIARVHRPAGPPWSRCPACNHALQQRSSFEARGEVPARVTRAGAPLTYCPSCGKWFWRGGHVERLTAWLEAALGEPLASPPRDPAPPSDT